MKMHVDSWGAYGGYKKSDGRRYSAEAARNKACYKAKRIARNRRKRKANRRSKQANRHR